MKSDLFTERWKIEYCQVCNIESFEDDNRCDLMA